MGVDEVAYEFETMHPGEVKLAASPVSNAVERSKHLIEAAAAAANDIAHRFQPLLAQVPTEVSEIEVQFGLTITGEGKILVASASASASIQFTIKLEKHNVSKEATKA